MSSSESVTEKRTVITSSSSGGGGGYETLDDIPYKANIGSGRSSNIISRSSFPSRSSSGGTSIIRTVEYGYGSAGGMGMGPGGYSNVSNTGVTSVKTNREREKRDLQDLNERFANYIEKVRFLEAQNRKLGTELDELRSKWGKETTHIKQMYEAELSEARRLIDDLSKDKAALEIKTSSVQEQNSELNRQLDEAKKYRAQDRDHINKLNQQIADLESEINMLRRSMESLETERGRDKATINRLQQEVDKLRIDLNNETLTHLDAENRRQTLEEEMEFMKKVHEQELKELAALAYRDTTAENREFWKNELGQAIRDIQQEYDAKVDQIRGDMEGFYNLKIQEFRTGATKQNMEVTHIREENKKISKQMTDLRGKLADMEARNAQLEKQYQEVLRELETKETDHMMECTQFREEISKLRIEMEGILQELQTLMDAKLSLELEISAYRKLLEGEENRVDWRSRASLIMYRDAFRPSRPSYERPETDRESIERPKQPERSEPEKSEKEQVKQKQPEKPTELVKPEATQPKPVVEHIQKQSEQNISCIPEPKDASPDTDAASSITMSDIASPRDELAPGDELEYEPQSKDTETDITKYMLSPTEHDDKGNDKPASPVEIVHVKDEVQRLESRMKDHTDGTDDSLSPTIQSPIKSDDNQEELPAKDDQDSRDGINESKESPKLVDDNDDVLQSSQISVELDKTQELSEKTSPTKDPIDDKGEIIEEQEIKAESPASQTFAAKDDETMTTEKSETRSPSVESPESDEPDAPDQITTEPVCETDIKSEKPVEVESDHESVAKSDIPEDLTGTMPNKEQESDITKDKTNETNTSTDDIQIKEIDNLEQETQLKSPTKPVVVGLNEYMKMKNEEEQMTPNEDKDNDDAKVDKREDFEEKSDEQTSPKSPVKPNLNVVGLDEYMKQQAEDDTKSPASSKSKDSPVKDDVPKSPQSLPIDKTPEDSQKLLDSTEDRQDELLSPKEVAESNQFHEQSATLPIGGKESKKASPVTSPVNTASDKENELTKNVEDEKSIDESKKDDENLADSAKTPDDNEIVTVDVIEKTEDKVLETAVPSEVVEKETTAEVATVESSPTKELPEPSIEELETAQVKKQESETESPTKLVDPIPSLMTQSIIETLPDKSPSPTKDDKTPSPTKTEEDLKPQMTQEEAAVTDEKSEYAIKQSETDQMTESMIVDDSVDNSVQSENVDQMTHSMPAPATPPPTPATQPASPNLSRSETKEDSAAIIDDKSPVEPETTEATGYDEIDKTKDETATKETLEHELKPEADDLKQSDSDEKLDATMDISSSNVDVESKPDQSSPVSETQELMPIVLTKDTEDPMQTSIIEVQSESDQLPTVHTETVELKAEESEVKNYEKESEHISVTKDATSPGVTDAYDSIKRESNDLQSESQTVEMADEIKSPSDEHSVEQKAESELEITSTTEELSNKDIESKDDTSEIKSESQVNVPLEVSAKEVVESVDVANDSYVDGEGNVDQVKQAEPETTEKESTKQDEASEEKSEDENLEKKQDDITDVVENHVESEEESKITDETATKEKGVVDEEPMVNGVNGELHSDAGSKTSPTELKTIEKLLINGDVYPEVTVEAFKPDSAVSMKMMRGEVSAKTTFQRQSTGPIAISEVSPEGKFIMLENTSSGPNRRDVNLDGWKLRRLVDGKRDYSYNFRNFTLKSGKKVKILARGAASDAGLNDLVFREEDNWGVGSQVNTALINDKEEEKASHIQKTLYN